MAHSNPWTQRLKTALLANPELRTTFSPEAIEATCRSLGYHWRKSFWNPTVTLLTFLLQVLSAEKSLRAAVADLIAHRAAQGEPLPSSPDPSAYCQARQRLPFEGERGQREKGVRLTSWVPARPDRDGEGRSEPAECPDADVQRGAATGL